MRKVVLYQLLSLDGVAEEPGDWMSDGSPQIFENLGRVIAPQTDILLGRATYDYWVDYWPSSDLEPFASFINGTTKHVFTSAPPARDWPNTTFVHQPAAEYVAALKQQPGGDIGVHGSLRLAGDLLRVGLIDEMRLVVAAAVAGRGRRMLDADSPSHALELLDADTTPGGSLLLGYRIRPGHQPAADH